MKQIKYVNDFIRVNPFWLDASGEFIRDPEVYPTAPEGWSVETAHRDAETGLLLWYVVADFDTPEAALAVAGGALS